MKKLALTRLVCVLPMQHAVIAQQARAPRIAHDWCYPRVDDGGWTSIDICEVQIFDSPPEHAGTWSSASTSSTTLPAAAACSSRTPASSTTRTSFLQPCRAKGRLSLPTTGGRDGAPAIA